MEPHIAHWHCRYRIVDAGGGASVAAARLDREVRSGAAEVYSQALSQAFENDPAVYVLRRAHVRIAIRNAAELTGPAIAREWGRTAAMSVARSVIRPQQQDELMRFEETGEYIARFIIDLVDGLAWDRWYYCAFRAYRLLAPQEAIGAVLTDNREHLAAVFRYLARFGRLDATLRRLSSDTTEAVWRRAVLASADRSRGADEFRIFVQAAFRILTALGMWSGAPPVESDFLDAYVAGQPPLPDWKDPRSLAAAVLDAIEVAVRTGFAQFEHSDVYARTEKRIAEVCSEFEWLDRSRLGEAVRARMTAASAKDSPQALTDFRAPTLLQHQIVDALLRAVHARGLVLPDDTHSAALQLFALLSASEPDLAGHTAAPALIRLIVECVRALRQAPAVEPLLAAIAHPASSPAPAGVSRQSHELVAAAARFEKPMAALLEVLLGPLSKATRAGSPRTIETPYAGLFLLARAVMEARIPQIAAAVGAEPLETVLKGIGVEWAGPAATSPGPTEPGLLFWCGAESEEELSPVYPERLEALRQSVERLFEDRRRLDPSLPAIRTAASPIAFIADAALALWARWLPAIGGSSAECLLDNLIRRPGSLDITDSEVRVGMRPAPLDIVLELSSYLQPIETVPWMGNRKVWFRIDRGGA